MRDPNSLLSALVLSCSACGGDSPKFVTCEAVPPGDFVTVGEECRDFLGPGDGEPDAAVSTVVACEGAAEFGSLIRTVEGDGSVLNSWIRPGADAVLEVQRDGLCRRRLYLTCAGSPYTLAAAASTTDGFEVVLGTDVGLYWNYVTAEGDAGDACVPIGGPAEPNTDPRWLVMSEWRILLQADLGANDMTVTVFDPTIAVASTQSLGMSVTPSDVAVTPDRMLVVGQGQGGKVFDMLLPDLVFVGDAALPSPDAVLNPRVATRGDEFVAVWWQGGVPRQVWAARIMGDGEVAAGPALVAEGLEPDVAVSGNQISIVYTSEQPGQAGAYCLSTLQWAELGADLSLIGPILIGSAGATGRLFEYEVMPARTGFRIASREEVWRRAVFGPRLLCGAPVFTEIAAGSIQAQYIPATGAAAQDP